MFQIPGTNPFVCIWMKTKSPRRWCVIDITLVYKVYLAYGYCTYTSKVLMALHFKLELFVALFQDHTNHCDLADYLAHNVATFANNRQSWRFLVHFSENWWLYFSLIWQHNMIWRTLTAPSLYQPQPVTIYIIQIYYWFQEEWNFGSSDQEGLVIFL